MFIHNKRFVTILMIIAFLLLIPFIAMQFTEEVKWSGFDFAVMAILLLGTGLLIELFLRKVKNRNYRIAFIIIVLLALLLVWAELAVGIFGTYLSGD